MAFQKNTERKSVAGMREDEKVALMEVTLEGMVTGKTLQDVVQGLGYDPSTIRRWLADDGSGRGGIAKQGYCRGKQWQRKRFV